MIMKEQFSAPFFIWVARYCTPRVAGCNSAESSGTRLNIPTKKTETAFWKNAFNKVQAFTLTDS